MSGQPGDDGGEGAFSTWLRPAISALAVVSALAGASKTVHDDVALLAEIPAPVLLGLAVVLLGGLGAEWLARRRQRSSIVDPAPLGLGRDGQMVGRADDVSRLVSLTKNSPLVWLVGESGSGKTTLLKCGLVPELVREVGFAVAYFEALGQDWEASAYLALRRELGLSPPEVVGSWRDRLLPGLPEGKRVILLFDQFDAYVQLHRSQLLTVDGGVRTAQDIRRSNRFWDDVFQAADAGVVTCLVACRSDAVHALETVRFRQPEYHRLGRLGSGYVLPLLLSVSAGAVRNPENGFTLLAKQLAADLERDGDVLPVRMRMAFASLRTLPFLTLEAYEGAGRVTGLEARAIHYALREAAASARMREQDVLQLLLALAERDDRPSIQWTVDELSTRLPEDVSKEAIRISLEHLLQTGLVRLSVQHPTFDTPTWQLGHDYLCAGVRELEAGGQRWQRELLTRADRFTSAGTAWERWRTLLTPTEQARVLYRAAVGGLRYGRARNFALWSLGRLVVNPATLLVCLAAALARETAIDREARSLFAPLGVSETRRGRSMTEGTTLRDMASASLPVKRALVDLAFEHPGNTDRFMRRYEDLVLALVGLSTAQRDTVFGPLLESCAVGTWPDETRRRACVTLAVALSSDEDLADDVRLASIIDVWAGSEGTIGPKTLCWSSSYSYESDSCHRGLPALVRVSSADIVMRSYAKLEEDWNSHGSGGGYRPDDARVAALLLGKMSNESRGDAVSRLVDTSIVGRGRPEAILVLRRAGTAGELARGVAAYLKGWTDKTPTYPWTSTDDGLGPLSPAVCEQLLLGLVARARATPSGIRAIFDPCRGEASTPLPEWHVRFANAFNARFDASACETLLSAGGPWTLWETVCGSLREERSDPLSRWIHSVSARARLAAGQERGSAALLAAADVLEGRLAFDASFTSLPSLRDIGGPLIPDLVTALLLHAPSQHVGLATRLLERAERDFGSRGSILRERRAIVSLLPIASQEALLAAWDPGSAPLGLVDALAAFPAAKTARFDERLLDARVSSRFLSYWDAVFEHLPDPLRLKAGQGAVERLRTALRDDRLDGLTSSDVQALRYAGQVSSESRVALQRGLLDLDMRTLTDTQRELMVRALVNLGEPLDARQIVRFYSRNDTVDGELFAGLVAAVPRGQRQRSIKALEEAFRGSLSPRCAAVAPLLRKDDLRVVASILSIPTCSAAERRALGAAYGRALAESERTPAWLARGTDGKPDVDWWAMVAWFEERNVRSP